MPEPKITDIVCTRQMMRVGKRIVPGPWIPLGHKQHVDGKEEIILKVLPIGGWTGYLRCFSLNDPLPDPIWIPQHPELEDSGEDDDY